MNLWYALTIIGDPLIWMVSTTLIAVAYALARKRISKDKNNVLKKCVFVYIVSVWLTLGTVFLLKSAIHMERPCVPCGPQMEECNPYCLADNSFPSGHSAAIFAVFSSLYICTRKKWFTPLFIIPLLVSVSRYFLVVHYMIDIFFGTVIGVFVPIIVLFFYERKF